MILDVSLCVGKKTIDLSADKQLFQSVLISTALIVGVVTEW